MSDLSTDNFRKHTTTNPLQRILIDNFFKYLLAEVKSMQPKSILDVGCGEGFTLEKLRNMGIGERLVGVDFSESAIEIGHNAHPELDLKIGSIYEIPFKDNQFDLVICTEVLEHLDDPKKALSELARVCKGSCLISVPHEPWFMLANFLRGKNWSRWGNDIEHINHWSRAGIGRLVNNYMDVKRIKNPFPWTMLVADRKV